MARHANIEDFIILTFFIILHIPVTFLGITWQFIICYIKYGYLHEECQVYKLNFMFLYGYYPSQVASNVLSI